MQLDVDQGSSASDGEEEKELGSNDEQVCRETVSVDITKISI